MKVLTNAQMRECDRYATEVLKIPEITLMERAGTALADEAERAAKRLGASDILVVCGTGNNGGDGYVCAAALHSRGFNVAIYAFEGKFSPCTEAMKKQSKCRYSRHITGAIIIDCIFGTGISREICGIYKEVIEKINSSGAYVISADIPSGLNDSGKVCGCAVKANLTLAIGQYKTGMFLGDGMDYCGELALADIGIPLLDKPYAELIAAEEIKACYPPRRRNSHKGTYGTAQIVAGSEKYAGAAALAVQGALRSGCGYVKLKADKAVKNLLVAKFPQAIFSETDFSAEAVAVGMGMGVSESTYAAVCSLLKNFKGSLIIDADGLNSLARFGKEVLKDKNCDVIITPHVKEFSRLTGRGVEDILNDPIGCAVKFSREYNVIVLLKGAATIICRGDRVAINARGTTALSKGGSGDILSGFMCGCLARGLAPFEAAGCAAFTLGVAAEIASREKTDYCATAQDIIKNLFFSVKRLTEL